MPKLITAFLCLLLTGAACAQERFSLYVGTEPDDVVRMLDIAGVRAGDVIYDLGSGDGRIVLEAARRNPGILGRGIDIDEQLVRESTAAAKKSGLADRVTFIHQNAFDADLKEATVIVMWLWPELMRMLRPKLLAEARPGTRVITRLWDLGSWTPDETDPKGVPLFKWIVPAKVDGLWDWKLGFGGRTHVYSAVVEQRFQNAEGVVRVGNRRGVIDSMKLSGEEISFNVHMTVEPGGFVRHEFSGRVRDGVIEGIARVLQHPDKEPIEMPWRAERVRSSAYYAPTGVDAK